MLLSDVRHFLINDICVSQLGTYQQSEEGIGGAAARPGPSSIAVPTASVPITVLLYSTLYDGQFLCGFNLPVKWLKQ